MEKQTKDVNSGTETVQGSPRSSSYIKWLEKNSMFYNARQILKDFIGTKNEWQHPFSYPITEEVLKKYPVMFTAYPHSTLTAEGQSFLKYYSQKEIWKIFEEIGIQILHTCPVKKSGGVKKYEFTPTIDGYFDRIALQVAPEFGSDEEYRKLAGTAGEYGGIVLGDIVPGHTGKGPDFMLALMFYENYAGLYDIVEIEKEDWPLLPEIEKGKESAHLSSEQISLLREKGYIPGPCFKAFDEGGWSATPEIIGADGKTRRILFFHAFKSGQPSLNWTSPTAAASQLINADIVQSLCQLGAGALRLDATPFCGIIVDPETQSEPGSPVSIYTTKMLAGLIRKYGGWSYQELNTPFELVKKYSGSDLYYDFFTRPAIEHAALTGDASFLYIMNELMTNHGIDQKMLIHDTQNHDEITYGIPQLDDPSFNVEYHGKEMPASEVRKIILEQKDQIAVNSYNKGFTDGVATTIAGYLAAGLEVKDIYNLTEREKQKIQELHTLIIFYNAMQPGLFGISGWDMVGALPIPEGGIEELLEDGDTRWHNRGSYDLLGNNTSTENLPTVLPKCKMIYGPVPQQLKKPDSFCSKIKKILSARTKYKIQLSDQVAVIKPQNTSAFISLQRLPDNKGIEISALNFGNKEVTETLKLSDIKQIELKNYSDKAVDIFDQAVDSKVSNGELKIHLSSRSCKALLLESV